LTRRTFGHPAYDPLKVCLRQEGASLEFRLLGPLEVVGDDGAPVALGGRRPRALLTQLLLHANSPVPTERLIDAVWGEEPPAGAHAALQVHVHALRKALGADRIVTRPPGYVVRVEPGELDLERFERHVADARPHDALALWRGPALAGVADAPFARPEAARLEDARLAAVEARIDADLGEGRHAELAGELEALVATHPYRERLHAQRMLALYRAGRQADALAAYRDARAALDEIGLEPSAELRTLEQHILRQDAALDAVPRSASAGTRRAALPADPTPLVGRELEVAAVSGLLGRPDTRLVTLTGPGGTGKTRLARAAGRALAADGTRVLFVDLSAVTDPSLVLSTVAHAVGAEEASGESAVATLVEALGEGPVLLALDNFEQVLDAASSVAALLEAAPALRLLVTSRAPLRIGSERVYPVSPLAVPPAEARTAASIRDVAAVRLYVERARATDPEFALTDENADAVGRICRGLDGLPLALELAAARVRTLGPNGTAARLGERLSLLSRGARDLPERQRSLRATLDWSVQLLDEPARRLLATLAVFGGAASLEAIEAVWEGDDATASLDDVLDAALVISGSAADGAPRFGMLETVREYALELLEGSGEEVSVRDRHLDWCLRLVEGDGLYWQRVVDAAWLDRIELEHDNMRAALSHARATDDIERELRLATALRYFWRVRGYVDEGRRRLEEVLERSAGVGPALRARILSEAGVMSFTAGDYARSKSLWQEALPLIESLGDQRDIGRALGELGACHHAEGDLTGATGYYESSNEALERAGDRQSQGVILSNLASVYHTLGQLDRARETSHAALRIAEEIEDADGIAFSSLNIAEIELDDGQLAATARGLTDALDGALRLGHREITAYALGLTARLALAIGRVEDAGTLSGAFLEQFRAMGTTPQPENAQRNEELRSAVAPLIDLDAALERGASLTADETTSLAHDELAAAVAGSENDG
jgi:predicted ATPase/DNA-binding SARP family transcriptional activator